MQCKLCNSEKIKLFHRGTRNSKENVPANFSPTSSDFGLFYKTFICADCGFMFSDLEMKEGELNELYSSAVDGVYVLQQQERQYAYKNVLSQLKPLTICEGARLLDIGCSYGLFLKLAKDYGYNVYGVEASRDASDYCKDKLGLNVFCGDISQVVFSDNYFDIATALEVIEHVDNLKVFIAKIRNMLKTGGILYIVTPNTRSLSARLLGKRWWSYRRMHVSYFSKRALQLFLKNNGFEVISCNPYKKTFKINYILHQLSQFNKGLFKLFDNLARLTRVGDKLITVSYGDMALIAKKI